MAKQNEFAALRNFAETGSAAAILAVLDCPCIDDLSEEVIDEAVLALDSLIEKLPGQAMLIGGKGWNTIITQAEALRDRILA